LNGRIPRAYRNLTGAGNGAYRYHTRAAGPAMIPGPTAYRSDPQACITASRFTGTAAGSGQITTDDRVLEGLDLHRLFCDLTGEAVGHLGAGLHREGYCVEPDAKATTHVTLTVTVGIIAWPDTPGVTTRYRPITSPIYHYAYRGPELITLMLDAWHNANLTTYRPVWLHHPTDPIPVGVRDYFSGCVEEDDRTTPGTWRLGEDLT
jgi:hypothetical protein